MSEAFPLPLRVEFMDGGLWRLTHPFVFRPPARWPVKIPAGEVTDFASIPRVFQNLVSPTDGIGKAAVVHDHLYRTGELPRAVADEILLEAMEAESAEEIAVGRHGVGVLKRTLIYLHVRWWGWVAWGEHRKVESRKQKAENRK